MCEQAEPIELDLSFEEEEMIHSTAISLQITDEELCRGATQLFCNARTHCAQVHPIRSWPFFNGRDDDTPPEDDFDDDDRRDE